MAQAKIPVMLTGQVLGVAEKKNDSGKVQMIARVLVPVPGDMPETVDVRGWPADYTPKNGETVRFSAIVRAWEMNGRSGVSVNFVSLFETPKAEAKAN